MYGTLLESHSATDRMNLSEMLLNRKTVLISFHCLEFRANLVAMLRLCLEDVWLKHIFVNHISRVVCFAEYKSKLKNADFKQKKRHV